MENFNEWRNQLEYFLKNKKYPLCHKCSSIILVTKMDIFKNTIEYKCENCFIQKEINLLEYFSTEFEVNHHREIKPKKICEIHKKKITNFCKTCMEANCDDCRDYPKHEFFDLNKNIINNNKLKEIEKEVQNERDCFIKIININNLINFYNNNNNEKIKKYKNKTSSDILFNNNDFLRILYIHIYEKLLIPDYKKKLIELNKEYPNDYFCIQNVLLINIISDIIIKYRNILYEELLINSIEIFEKYKNEYFLEYMDTRTFNLEKIKTNNNDIKFNHNKNKVNPFMLLEDNNSVLYFGEGIFYINIKTGHYNYFKLSDYINGEDINPKLCILENNKFILYFDSIIKIYKYGKNKLKNIFSKKFDEKVKIDNIFKLFKAKYILIQFKDNNFQIFYETKSNLYEKVFEFSNSNYYDLNQIDYFGKLDEAYFSGKDKLKTFIFIMKFSLNSEKQINYDIEYLPIKYVIEYKFISDKKLLIKCFELEYNSYIIYDLGNKQIETAFRYKYKNIIKNVFKGDIYEFVLKEYSYEFNTLYNNNYYKYFILKRNKDEIIFISKQTNYNIFKIFKYTYNNKFSSIKKDDNLNFNYKSYINNMHLFCINF